MDKKLNKQTFCLVSVGFKLIAILLTTLLLALSIVLCVYLLFWYAILFSWVVTLLCLLTTILCFLNKIVLDVNKGALVIFTFKKRELNLEDISSVEINNINSVDDKKYCNIIFNMMDGKDFNIAGYTSILRNKSVNRTKNIVDKLNEALEICTKQHSKIEKNI